MTRSTVTARRKGDPQHYVERKTIPKRETNNNLKGVQKCVLMFFDHSSYFQHVASMQPRRAYFITPVKSVLGSIEVWRNPGRPKYLLDIFVWEELKKRKGVVKVRRSGALNMNMSIYLQISICIYIYMYIIYIYIYTRILSPPLAGHKNQKKTLIEMIV